MSERRVRLIHVVIEQREAGVAVATSPSLPDFYLVTEQGRLDKDIPTAIRRLYEMRYGVQSIEILPVEADDEASLAQWAAIIASERVAANM